MESNGQSERASEKHICSLEKGETKGQMSERALCETGHGWGEVMMGNARPACHTPASSNVRPACHRRT